MPLTSPSTDLISGARSCIGRASAGPDLAENARAGTSGNTDPLETLSERLKTVEKLPIWKELLDPEMGVSDAMPLPNIVGQMESCPGDARKFVRKREIL